MPTMQAKRGPGRPPTVAEDGDSVQIGLRLPRPMHDWLAEASKRQGGSGRTAVIRRLIAEAMDRDEKK